MTNLIEEFIIIFTIVFCLNKIFIYFKNKNKKMKNVLTSEMILLIRFYGINISKIGKDKVENDISIINSIIITSDLLVYYNVKNMVYMVILIFAITFVSILVCYSLLARIYNNVR